VIWKFAGTAEPVSAISKVGARESLLARCTVPVAGPRAVRSYRIPRVAKPAAWIVIGVPAPE
jgi:hypothetical protein